jgi:hypothetical protein
MIKTKKAKVIALEASNYVCWTKMVKFESIYEVIKSDYLGTQIRVGKLPFWVDNECLEEVKDEE